MSNEEWNSKTKDIKDPTFLKVQKYSKYPQFADYIKQATEQAIRHFEKDNNITQ